MRVVIGALLAIAVSDLASAEVCPKYRDGCAPLAAFVCTPTPRSNSVRRVCYDPSNSYMVINLKGTDYHYCGIDAGTVAGLIGADSVGLFYNGSIKGRFDCRTGRIPNY